MPLYLSLPLLPGQCSVAGITTVMSGRYAFVTLISSDSYLPGALAVAAALREVHPSPPVEPEVPFQTVCLVTPETVDVKTIKHLRKAFDSVIGVEVLEGDTSAELQLLGESSFSVCSLLFAQCAVRHAELRFHSNLLGVEPSLCT